MITILILGILIAIGIVGYNQVLVKSNEGATKGNLSAIRSALSIYYGDNDSIAHPTDDLSCLLTGMKYLPAIPPVNTEPSHPKAVGVLTEASPTDSGVWSYDNNSANVTWGQIRVGCSHQDTRNTIWSAY